MAEFVYDLRLASSRLPEDDTSRSGGGEVSYAGKATRGGIVSVLGFTPTNPALLAQAVNVGDYYNIMVKVPEKERWFVRGYGVRTVQVGPAATLFRMSVHGWKPISRWDQLAEHWVNYDANASPALPPYGLEPFVYSTQYWRQLAAQKNVPVAAGTRHVQWTFDTEVWQRDLYPREILLFRVEVAASAAGSKSTIIPFIDIVRYPTAREIINRLTQRDGAMRADVTFASIIEAGLDTMALED